MNDFVKELKQLLKKYNVTLSAEDHYQGYPECGEDIRITAEFNDYDYEDVDFGQYIIGE